MLAGAGSELFDIVLRMDGLGKFAEEVNNCVEISLGRHRLKVLSLERVLASKLAANRPKDKLTIPVLRDALTTTKSLKPSLGSVKTRTRRKSTAAERKSP